MSGQEFSKSPDVGLRLDLPAVATVLKNLPVHQWAYSEEETQDYEGSISKTNFYRYSTVVNTPEGDVWVRVQRTELTPRPEWNWPYSLTARKVGSDSGSYSLYSHSVGKEDGKILEDLFLDIDTRYKGASDGGRLVANGQDAVSALRSLIGREVALPLALVLREWERMRKTNMLGDAGFSPEQIERIWQVVDAPVEQGQATTPNASL